MFQFLILIARELFDQQRLREQRIELVHQMLLRGDQSGVALRRALSSAGIGMSAVRFYALMSTETFPKLYYVELPFSRVPMFRITS